MQRLPLPSKTTAPSRALYLFLCSLLFSGITHAQNFAALALPDAPDMSAIAASDAAYSSSSDAIDPQGDNQSAPVHQDQQTKRILGVVPNFRAVSANTHLPPQSVKEKFITATEDSFDYSSILLPAVLAGYGQLTNQTPEFRQGAAGYGRYFWHSFVDQADENYFVEFIVPTLTHEDTRYYTMGSGGFKKRAIYAVSRVIITRSDSGHNTFNASEIIGAGAASGISNLYYPRPERTAGNTVQKWGLNVGIDAATFTFKEFWPDINHALFHGKQ